MNYFSLTVLLLLGVLGPVQAQYVTVQYDAEQNWFNQGQALPAETDMVLTGTVPEDAVLLEFSVLDAKRGDVLHTASWRRGEMSTEYTLPVNYKLRPATVYDFYLKTYRQATQTEINDLRKHLQLSLHALLDVSLKEANSIEFKGKPKRVYAQLNELLHDQLLEYRTKISNWDPQFSELVLLKLEQMERSDLDRNFVRTDTTQSRQDVRMSAKDTQFAEFKQLIAAELSTILNMDLYRLEEARLIDDYRTERKPNVLSLSIGYGGAYLSGKLDDGQYGSAPYAGIALPLGNRVLGTKFFRNASLNLGVFLDEFEAANGQDVKGFLIDQPLYIGLDYKLFQFIRLNAGATLLDGGTLPDGTDVTGNQSLSVRPFVGLSARIDLQLGLGK